LLCRSKCRNSSRDKVGVKAALSGAY
jgi:hypothetical protein